MMLRSPKEVSRLNDVHRRTDEVLKPNGAFTTGQMHWSVLRVPTDKQNVASSRQPSLVAGVSSIRWIISEPQTLLKPSKAG